MIDTEGTMGRENVAFSNSDFKPFRSTNSCFRARLDFKRHLLWKPILQFKTLKIATFHNKMLQVRESEKVSRILLTSPNSNY
jgi:hypothetical protein